MSVSSVLFPPKDPAMPPVKKKRVLLVDSSRTKRDLRSETMRKLGVDVDCAADISEARCWWRPGLYDLVLLHVLDSNGPVAKFCHDVRNATPPQRTRFLVGGPAYLAASPDAIQEAEDPEPARVEAVAAANVGSSQARPSLLEACRRISAVRSVCEARMRAIRDRPEPRRDNQSSESSRTLDADTTKFVQVEVQ